jgi:FAD dependent oxidoreductase
MPSQDKPEEVLSQYKIADRVYILGTFETGLTIYSQQVRALNLVWSLVEAVPESELRNIAIVGGGFAGLTAAAGLLHKGVQHISLFERRATLCPLQLGSDTRWVHPHIYDWPDDGSKFPTAALPLLNWNAGRASDVAVEIMQAWEKLTRSVDRSRIDTYLNVKHLRLDDTLHLEWVGEKSKIDSVAVPSGDKAQFDSVVLAVGFGLERECAFSYWRNETLGQPELDLGKRTYLVSGHGDGALVDLFRIRISRFRQDRILVDLFSDNSNLVRILRETKRTLDNGTIDSEKLYDRLEEIAADKNSGFERLVGALRTRLRADTAAILQTRKTVDSFKKIFSTPASFQNRFLLYALYRAGGFIPIFKEDHQKICEEYGIRAADIIRRYGTDRSEAVEDVLDDALLKKSKAELARLKGGGKQSSTVSWSGGYWHLVSSKLGGQGLEVDTSKAKWRLEHLPSATEVIVTGFISAVAGYLDSLGTTGLDFRVTLHRTLFIGTEATLQQTAPYAGSPKRPGDSGRTFGFTKGTIGYAATARQAARTRPQAENETDGDYAKAIQDDMKVLDVEAHSQPNPTVRSVLAVPIFGWTANSVVAVVYADSTECNVFTDECVTVINKMCQRFGSMIGNIHSDRVFNFSHSARETPTALPFEPHRLQVIEIVKEQFGEIAATADSLNLEFTDFVTLRDGDY